MLKIKKIDNGFLVIHDGVETAITDPPYEEKDDQSRFYKMNEEQRLMAALLYHVFDELQYGLEDKYSRENIRITYDRLGHKV